MQKKTVLLQISFIEFRHASSWTSHPKGPMIGYNGRCQLTCLARMEPRSLNKPKYIRMSLIIQSIIIRYLVRNKIVLSYKSRHPQCQNHDTRASLFPINGKITMDLSDNLFHTMLISIGYHLLCKMLTPLFAWLVTSYFIQERVK